MTPLQWATHLHQQAVRNLRRLDAEARRQGRSPALEGARMYYHDRVAKTLADLQAIEATQHAGTLEGPAPDPQPQPTNTRT